MPNINTQPHYQKADYSLYKFAMDWKLNAYQFDLIKRIVRIEDKGQFDEDIQKTHDLLEIYKKEYHERIS